MHHNLKQDFPIFLHHPKLVYLDSAATSLKPSAVIQKELEYYEQYTANVHRGIYALAEQATAEYEKTRTTVASFINAARPEEVVFTKGTTEAINLLAASLAEQVQTGSSIVTTHLEHHSNFVPWQELATKRQAAFTVIQVREDGFLAVFNEEGTSVDYQQLEKYINAKTKIVALSGLSNVLGTIQPIPSLIQAIKTIAPECMVIVDAAQLISHHGLDVKALGADFVAFSSHKMLGPTGVGVLWGKHHLLETLPPYQFGGEMVYQVGNEATTYKVPPYKFEAGTPNVAGVIGLQAAIEYLSSVGIDQICQHESELVTYGLNQFKEHFPDDIRLLGTADPAKRAGIIAFTFANYHAHDIAQILDEHQIAVRAGHHCTMPLHTRFDVNASVRASFHLYTTKSDIDALINGLKQVKTVLK